MNAPADSTAGSQAGAAEPVANGIARALGITADGAQRLADSGYDSVDKVRALPPDELARLGVSTADIDRIQRPPSAGPSEASDPWATDSARLSQRLIQSVRPRERARHRRTSPPPKDSMDVVRKWVGGDDRALEAWIRSTPVGEPAAETSAGRTAAAPSGAAALPGGAVAPSLDVMEREKTVVRWLTELLDRMKSDQFDPAAVLQDIQDLQRELYDERAKRAQLEAEIEHVKRGSIAVIKFVRSREAKLREQGVQEKEAEIASLKLRLLQSPPDAGAPSPPPPPTGDWAENEARLREEFGAREAEYADREAELRRRVVQLEGELREQRVAAQSIAEHQAVIGQKPAAASEIVTRRLSEVEAREKELATRENELRSKFEEIRIRAQEVERQVEPIRFKQNELRSWELQLQRTKAAIEIEARRIEQVRQEGSDEARLTELRRIEDLRNEVARKEETLRAREEQLHQQQADLQKQLVQAEADGMHEAAVEVSKESKLTTGVRRLDDLLFGGLPLGGQILVNGPAHTGKETLARLFVAEGLRRGTPVIWVVTDKTYLQVREEMTALLPTYPQLEAKGLVRYVDLYSRSLGVTQTEAGVKLFQSTDKGALDQLTQAVNAYAQELKAVAPSYRLVFESVSTVTAYLDLASTFRFFQPFAGRRKLDGAVAYYLLETGMHSEADMETLEHMVDGSLNLKVEQLKTFLSVRGITDVQSRAWVGYTFTKKTFNLGSFSLDHIR